MVQCGFTVGTVCLACVMLLPGPTCWAKTASPQSTVSTKKGANTLWFVSTKGSDANEGSVAHPWATIQHADQVAKPGDTVIVLDGTYRGSVALASSGTANHPLTYKAQNKWKAKLVGTGSGPGSAVIGVSGGHVIIQGFDIAGSDANGIILASSGSIASHNGAFENYVHDLVVPCDADSGTAIETGGGDNYHGIAHNAIVGNLIVNITPYKGCVGGHQASGLFAETPFTVIADNIVINAGYGIQCWHAASHVTIVGNTLVNNLRGITVGAGDAPYNTENDYTSVRNNVIYNSADMAIAETGRTGPHNLYTDNLVYGGSTSISLNNGLRATGTVVAKPPSFDNTRTAAGNYRLRRNSLAPWIVRGDTRASHMAGNPHIDELDTWWSGTSVEKVAPAASVTASATAVTIGQSSTITWKTKNAISATLNGIPVALNGSLSVQPTVTTSYKVVAISPSGKTDWGSVTITAR